MFDVLLGRATRRKSITKQVLLFLHDLVDVRVGVLENLCVKSLIGFVPVYFSLEAAGSTIRSCPHPNFFESNLLSDSSLQLDSCSKLCGQFTGFFLVKMLAGG